MKPLFIVRLALDFLAVGLLLAALAYFLFDNATHAVIGTAMFSWPIGHNIWSSLRSSLGGRGRSSAAGAN